MSGTAFLQYEAGKELEDGFELLADVVVKGWIVTDFLVKITKENGDKGTITLATDDCAVFKTGNTYYDYSDGYSSELFGFFGLTTEEIIDMTAKR